MLLLLLSFQAALVAAPARAAERLVRVHGHGGERTLVLDRIVGDGALSAAFEAHDQLRPGDRFAVKVLRHHLRGDPKNNTFPKENQILELMASRSAQFPKPCGVGEFLGSEPPGAPALAMEFLEGRPLGGAGPGRGWDNPLHLAPGKAVRVARTLLKRAAELHAAGWAHRDIHTANARINDRLDSASARLVDFGNAGPYNEKRAAKDVGDVARVLLENLTGRHYSDPQAMIDARGYRARVGGEERTLEDVIRKAMEGGYPTPADLDAALEPFSRLAR
jgi:serine/threonine protein kinase